MTSSDADLLVMNGLLHKRGREGPDAITADDSAFIKGFLDTANDEDKGLIALVFPCEFDEWCTETEEGIR